MRYNSRDFAMRLAFTLLFIMAIVTTFILGWWDAHEITPSVSMKGKSMLANASAYVSSDGVLKQIRSNVTDPRWEWNVFALGSSVNEKGRWTFATEGGINMTVVIVFTSSEVRVFWLPSAIVRVSQDNVDLRKRISSWCSNKHYTIHAVDESGKTIRLTGHELRAMLTREFGLSGSSENDSPAENE